MILNLTVDDKFFEFRGTDVNSTSFFRTFISQTIARNPRIGAAMFLHSFISSELIISPTFFIRPCSEKQIIRILSVVIGGFSRDVKSNRH